MWTMKRSGSKVAVAGNGESYRFSDKRRAKHVMEGRARGTMTREQAARLETLDRKQFG